jgi:hypothetical protein
MIYIFVTKLHYAFTLLTSLAIFAGLIGINVHYEAWQTRNIGEVITMLTIVFLLLINLCHYHILDRAKKLTKYDEIVEMVKVNFVSAKWVVAVYFVSVSILLFVLFSIETQFMTFAEFLTWFLISCSAIVAIAIPVYLYRVYRATKEQHMEFFKDKLKGE